MPASDSCRASWGASASGEEESFESGLLEYPHYYPPREWEGRAIPDILLSGDHGAIARWRRETGAQDHARNGARICAPHPIDQPE